MIEQGQLFEQSRHGPKAVRETSREALREILPTIRGRQHLVLVALSYYLHLYEAEPTSSELMRQMKVTDPNVVRPRLTDMAKPDKGLRYVEASESARKCKVTGKKAHTWRVTPRGEAYLRGQK